jgi:predicted MPP superfamily phosphohydrolase
MDQPDGPGPDGPAPGEDDGPGGDASRPSPPDRADPTDGPDGVADGTDLGAADTGPDDDDDAASTVRTGTGRTGVDATDTDDTDLDADPAPTHADATDTDDGTEGEPRNRRREDAPHRQWSERLTLVLFAAVGAVAALVIAGHIRAPIGPFDTTLSARPALGGDTTVELAPLGSLAMKTHRGPLALNLRVDELRVDEARAIANDPTQIDDLEQSLTEDTGEAVRRLAVRVGLAMVIGATALATLRRPRIRSALTGALTGVAMFTLAATITLATWRPEALAEPRYSGLLSMAPQAVGDARDVADRFTQYRTQLTALVQNVATLYETAEGLQSFQPDPTTIRVLHVSDLHLNPEAFDLIDQLVTQFGVDVVVDTGDINDWGTSFETSFVSRIGELDVPYVFIRGNHDSSITAEAVAAQPNALVLDGGRANVEGVAFWGIGDPRFTPDRSDDDGDAEAEAEEQRDIMKRFSTTVAGRLDDDGASSVDVVLVHDPAAAAQLEDTVPLVLAGHTHEPDDRKLGSTTLLVEGSTGGAGLRGLQRDEAVPLTTSVLYLDADTQRLQAYDRISVGGLGTGTASIERHVVAARTEEKIPTTTTTTG